MAHWQECRILQVSNCCTDMLLCPELLQSASSGFFRKSSGVANFLSSRLLTFAPSLPLNLVHTHAHTLNFTQAVPLLSPLFRLSSHAGLRLLGLAFHFPLAFVLIKDRSKWREARRQLTDKSWGAFRSRVPPHPCLIWCFHVSLVGLIGPCRQMFCFSWNITFLLLS